MPDDVVRTTEPTLPPGGLLLHIGPPKTGTTALQSALRDARPVMDAHGVAYPGSELNHSLAARAVLGRLAFKTHPPGDPVAWDRLLQQVAAVPAQRVIVSSEFFSNADDAGVQTIVSGLGGRPLHVLVTLRPLSKVLPSNWQQNVRTDQLRTCYEDWLVALLGPPPYGDGLPSFLDPYWQDRRRDDVLVERWASAVGAGSVTVVVVDESDPLVVLRTTERVLGLPGGLLRPARSANRSLAFGEVELLRALNEHFDQRGWSSEWYRRLYRAGPLRQLQRPSRRGEGSQQVTTPTWAADRIAQIGRMTAERISASGVRVVGDISSLGSPPPDDQPGEEGAVVSSEVAAAVVLSTILAAAGEEMSAAPRPAPVGHSHAQPAAQVGDGSMTALESSEAP